MVGRCEARSRHRHETETAAIWAGDSPVRQPAGAGPGATHQSAGSRTVAPPVEHRGERGGCEVMAGLRPQCPRRFTSRPSGHRPDPTASQAYRIQQAPPSGFRSSLEILGLRPDSGSWWRGIGQIAAMFSRFSGSRADRRKAIPLFRAGTPAQARAAQLHRCAYTLSGRQQANSGCPLMKASWRCRGSAPTQSA